MAVAGIVAGVALIALGTFYLLVAGRVDDPRFAAMRRSAWTRTPGAMRINGAFVMGAGILLIVYLALAR